VPCPPLTSPPGALNLPSGGSGPAPSGTRGLLWAAAGSPQCASHPGGRSGCLSLGSPAPGPTLQDALGPYLGQFHSQGHLEAQHPHFHGQHVVVTFGATRAMSNATCRDRGGWWAMAARSETCLSGWQGNGCRSTRLYSLHSGG
jgi:hypothetical protein